MMKIINKLKDFIIINIKMINYYYTLGRFYISNRIYLIHRNNLEKSWEKVQKHRRKLRVISSRKSYIDLLKKYKINNFS